MADIFQLYGKELVALLVPFITWILTVGLRAKAKLVWASPHAFTFLVPEPLRDAQGNILRPTQTLHTAAVRVHNIGRDTATQVELVFNWKPDCINLWPIRHYETHTEPDNRHVLIFASLAPKEDIGLEIMQVNHDLPALVTVRCDQGAAAQIPIRWVKAYPIWVYRVVGFFVLAGLGATVYLLIALIQALVLGTPVVWGTR